MSDRIIITLDGPAGSGKSTVARELAKALGYTYLDTGAMYRAVTLALLKSGVDSDDTDRIMEKLNHITVDIRYEMGVQKTYLDEVDVSDAIRKPDVTRRVSAVASIPQVRTYLVAQQQRMAQHGGYVLDGRDAGTVIFPQAEMKFYLTASVEERAKRRQLELAPHDPTLSLDQLVDEIRQRDHHDTNREASPLRRAADAVEIDNTRLSVQDQVSWIVKRFNERFRTTS